MLALAAAGLWLYGPVAAAMARAWLTQDNASHGFLIVPIAAYLVWRDHRRIGDAYRSGATAAGLAAAAFAGVLYLAGRLMDIEFLPPLSLVLMIAAQVLYFGGWSVLRAAAFPAAFLLFMVPWPDLLIEFLSFPMQLFSAKYATALAGMLGLQAQRSGVDIELSNFAFTVGAPCSGMKTLVALLALGALVAYMHNGPTPSSADSAVVAGATMAKSAAEPCRPRRRMWKRVLVFAAAAPFALMANVVRIVVILVIATVAGAGAAEGFFHAASGVLVFMLALAGLLGFAWAIGLRGFRAPEGESRGDRRAGTDG